MTNHLEEDKKSACKWAYELLQRNDWCVLDTETTSLDGIAVEISAIAPDGTILFDSLINPDGAPIHAKARAAHKITDEELASAPKLPEVWEQLCKALAPYKTIITYNAVFDQGILRRHAGRYKLPVLTHTWECAMERYAEFFGDWNDWHGSYRWQPLNGGHRALGDAQAALKRIHEMASYHVPEVKVMKIAIVGSRDFTDLAQVTSYVATLPPDSIIVSGGARGVDQQAEEIARARGLQVIIHKPDWDRYGRTAGIVRNQLIVDEADVLVAFWDGKSRGTKSSIDMANKKGIPVVIKEARPLSEEAVKAVQNYFAALKDGICPTCSQKVESKKQAGRCVYGQPCGHRLYQGSLPKEREWI